MTAAEEISLGGISRFFLEIMFQILLEKNLTLLLDAIMLIFQGIKQHWIPSCVIKKALSELLIYILLT